VHTPALSLILRSVSRHRAETKRWLDADDWAVAGRK
jgi:hypothetical protein